MKGLGQRLRSLWSGKRPETSSNVEELKLRYREFKYLLLANNEVLSIIAEIEQQLSEGAAAGLGFITSRYIASSAKVFKMILHLNRISGNTYPGLFQSFQAIRQQIDEALSKVARPELELVLPLSAVDRDLAYLVGAKAANLAAVGKMGLPIRTGFVITATAFRRMMEATGLEAEVRKELMFLKDLSYQNLAEMSRRLEARMLEAVLPAELEAAVAKATAELVGQLTGPKRLSVRSSAVGEDSEASFAGQFKTVLNVRPEETLSAYKKVVMSLYEPQAVVYRRRQNLRDKDAEMAVLVLGMLRPLASGVMYTRDPRLGEAGPLLINAVYGLGRGLVEGALSPDIYVLARQPKVSLIASRLGERSTRLVAAEEGIREEALEPELVGRPTLSQAQAEELAEMGLKLEAGFDGPQDIEWSLLPDGRFIIIQCRPLRTLEALEAASRIPVEQTPLIYEGGETARPGVGAGPAHLVLKEEDLNDFTPGAILVARQSSPVYAAVLSQATGVVTEIGGVTGHMASVARDFGVPALVGAKGVLSLIKPKEMITVDASSHRIFRGLAKSLLLDSQDKAKERRTARLKPAWHKAAQLITPLTLTDPRRPDFRPDNCQTFHDIIRFVHEKSFSEMFFLGDRLGRDAQNEARRMAYRLPFELWLIDLGGGLVERTDREIRLEELTSVPGRAFLEGLLDQRIRWDQPRPVSLRGLVSVFSGSIFTSYSDGQERDLGQKAFAIVSADYLNFNSRIGYHFAAIDSICCPNINDNYISFRFQGGAATEDRRVLRAELISLILFRSGFQMTQKGDMVHAFLKKYDQAATAERLRELGRLTLFTRQMDMLTHDRRMVNWLAQAYLSGNYNLDPTLGPKPEELTEPPQPGQTNQEQVSG